MKIMKIAIAYCVILTFVAFFSLATAETLNSDAISDVSKIITIGKSMNEDKNKARVERPVYVSSSLGGMVKQGSGGEVGVIKGLSALSQNQVDPILWWEFGNKLKDVSIVQDATLYNYRQGKPSSGAWSPYTRTIYVNSGNFGYDKTDLNRVIAHELAHANLDTTWQRNFGYPFGGRYPAGHEIRLHENMAKAYEQSFDKIRENRFNVENGIAQKMQQGGYKVTVYNSYPEYIKVQDTRWQLNNIPSSTMGKASKIDHLNYGSVGNNWNINRTIPSPTRAFPMPNTTYYPPPNILFSIKSPVSTYAPTYRVPTYTPTIPSSSGIRRY